MLGSFAHVLIAGHREEAVAGHWVESPIGAFTGVEHQDTRTPEMCQVSPSCLSSSTLHSLGGLSPGKAGGLVPRQSGYGPLRPRVLLITGASQVGPRWLLL